MNTAHNVTWRQMNPTTGIAPRPMFEVPARAAHAGAAVASFVLACAAGLAAAGVDVLAVAARAPLVLLPAALAFSTWAAWRTLELAVDPEGVSSTPRGMARRVGAGLSGVAHAGLAGLTGSLALGGDAAAATGLLPRLVQEPLGAAVVVVAAIAAVAAGASELPRAFGLAPLAAMDVSRMTRSERRFAFAAARVAAVAAGVGLPLLGLGIATAALGTARPFDAVLGHPIGALLCAAAAAGLLARAAHHALLARFRIVPKEDKDRAFASTPPRLAR